MSIMRVLMAFGTRPEIIKLGPVYRALSQTPGIKVDAFWSGQHIELAEGLLELFDIKVACQYDDLTTQSGMAGKMGQTLHRLSECLKTKDYDWIIVQGDTMTATSASIAGYLERIPVAHVEAGLRTGNLNSPWPEEFNRRIISLASDLHFAPTSEAKNNLLWEGIKEEQIHVTGNTVIDALNHVDRRINGNYTPISNELKQLPKNKKIVLMTGHRRENFGKPFENVLSALKTIAARSDVAVIFPVHLNPNIRTKVMKLLRGQPNIHLIKPLQYQDFIYMMRRAWVIVTDSGGIQEEAPSFNKPIIITRDTTERPEVIKAGFGHLVGCDKDLIVQKTEEFLSGNHPPFIEGYNPFGRGNSSLIISELLLSNWERRDAGIERETVKTEASEELASL